jgi:hypothetical protein
MEWCRGRCSGEEEEVGAVRYLEGEGVNVVIDLYNMGNTAEHSA